MFEASYYMIYCSCRSSRFIPRTRTIAFRNSRGTLAVLYKFIYTAVEGSV